MAYHFRNLIFEGGGVKGIAYVGALRALEGRKILEDIVRVGGTSVGAVNAALVGLGYGHAEIEKILAKLDFKEFLDDSWGVVRDSRRLVRRFGWYKGDYFRKWMGELVERKTGNSESTFRDIHEMKKGEGFRDMYLVGANVSTKFAEVFSFEHTPRMCVADAVRISMSIPLFFTAKRSPRGDVYVDGGVLDNYPIKLFDRKKYVEKYGRKTDYYAAHNKLLARRKKPTNPYLYNKETLGFRLDSPKEIAVFRDQAEPKRDRIEDFFDYTWALVRTVAGIQNSMHLHSDDWQRTIYIDTLGVKATDFGLGAAKKSALVSSGEKHTEAYFKWFDDFKKNKPVNHPRVRSPGETDRPMTRKHLRRVDTGA